MKIEAIRLFPSASSPSSNRQEILSRNLCAFHHLNNFSASIRHSIRLIEGELICKSFSRLNLAGAIRFSLKLVSAAVQASIMNGE